MKLRMDDDIFSSQILRLYPFLYVIFKKFYSGQTDLKWYNIPFNKMLVEFGDELPKTTPLRAHFHDG